MSNKNVKILLLAGLSACLMACGSSDKKPGEYYDAKRGEPVQLKTMKGVNAPIGLTPLDIPKAAQPLGAYNPDLKKPPRVVEVPE